MSPGTSSGQEESGHPKDQDNKVREVENILSDARKNQQTPLRQVHDIDDVYADSRFDPIESSKNEGTPSENGINIINSFINRTVFFDYFRHVAHKRFPEHHPNERVEEMIKSRPDLFKRAMNSDHVLKVVTSYVIIAAAGALIVKALFL